jgi:RNA polymerase sigma-70 factor, ECF subfamily
VPRAALIGSLSDSFQESGDFRELLARCGLYICNVPLLIDEITLAAARRHDVSAQTRIIEAMQQSVYSLCAALCGNEAEDLTQETFMRAFAALSRFDAGGSATFHTWLLVIARRACRDHARTRTRKPLVLDSDADTASDELGPSDVLHQSQQAVLVRAAVAELDEDHRAVIALRLWESLSYEEIAEIENVPVGTVRSRLARAKEQLRVHFLQLNGGTDEHHRKEFTHEER